MRCNCAMTSPKDTSLKEEGADADGVDRDGEEREEVATESDCCDRNWASLRLTVALSMAHMTVKWSEEGKGTEKWRKILVIVEEKMSLSWNAESR